MSMDKNARLNTHSECTIVSYPSYWCLLKFVVKFEAFENAVEMHGAKGTASNNLVFAWVTFVMRLSIKVCLSLVSFLLFSWIIVYATDAGHAQSFQLCQKFEQVRGKKKRKVKRLKREECCYAEANVWKKVNFQQGIPLVFWLVRRCLVPEQVVALLTLVNLPSGVAYLLGFLTY